MKKSLIIFIPLIVLACAQINDLTGGPKDTFAPAIDSAKSYPTNGQTNFQGDKIHLRFDEYITLSKPSENILITPRPKTNPIISSKNKTVEIEFVDELLPNTTYTISFNRAVTDITERNDSIFQYVFSTGNYIDSLSIEGKVFDAYTLQPSSNFLVALYEMNDSVSFDSIPAKLKPTYISQTDQSGSFKLNYLKYGLYYLFVFEDKNKNLVLDKDEKVAFIPEQKILVNPDIEFLRLASFKQEGTDEKLKKTEYSAPGKITFTFTSKPTNFDVATNLPLLFENSGKEDSLIYWLASPPVPKMQFYINYNEKLDTLKPLYKTSDKPSDLTYKTNIKSGKLNPNEKLKIEFSEPFLIENIDTSKLFIMTKDSLKISLRWEVENLRWLVADTVFSVPMILSVDSNAVTSIYGTSLLKEEHINFENHSSDYYGSVIVNCDSLSVANGIVYLMDENGKNVDTTVFSKQMKFENLLPGNYKLAIIIDADQNQEWTNGSLPDKRVPEKVIYFQGVITVKSKWVKEIDWIVTDIN